MDVLKELVAAIERNEAIALATVVEVIGASPAKVGAKILVRGDGTTVGTAGGGRLEQTIVADARAALDEGKSRLAHYTLREEGDNAIGVLCGGEARVFIEVFTPRPTLLIVGGGTRERLGDIPTAAVLPLHPAGAGGRGTIGRSR